MLKAIYLEPDQGKFRTLKYELRDLFKESQGMALVDQARNERELWIAMGREQYDVVLATYPQVEALQDGRSPVISRLLSRDASPPLVVLESPPRLTIDHARLSWVEQRRLAYLRQEDTAPERLQEALHQVMDRQVHLLVIDDDPVDYELICTQLALESSRRYVTTWAADIDEAQKIIDSGPDRFDAFIVDYRLPNGNGLDLIHSLLERGIHKPMLLVTASTQVDVDPEVMQLISSGQMKFLSKNHLGASQISSALRH